MKYEVSKIKSIGVELLHHAGLSISDAATCMDCLLTTDMRGVSSHGITHLKDICDRIDQGTIDVSAKIEMKQTAESTFIVNANHSVGIVSAMKTMEKCMELARKTGIALATIHNANTYGYGAFYSMYAADRQMIGFSACNTKAYVAPIGGSIPKLGTNTITIAIPTGKYSNFVLDMATSQVAVNKIALALKMGKSIPDNWAVGPNGEKTTDPSLAYSGALLPFGGYKGYGIQLAISLLAVALAGGDLDRDIPKAWADTDKECNFGCIMGAIDISKFVQPKSFCTRADELLEWVKSGHANSEMEKIIIPGERGYRQYSVAENEGIEITEKVIAELKQLSVRYNLSDSLSQLI